jgi:hypothetical protein
MRERLRVNGPFLYGGRMIIKADYKKFQAIMNKHRPENPVTETEAAEAFHNLVEYVRLLIEINDRVGLVPFGRKNKK